MWTPARRRTIKPRNSETLEIRGRGASIKVRVRPKSAIVGTLMLECGILRIFLKCGHHSHVHDASAIARVRLGMLADCDACPRVEQPIAGASIPAAENLAAETRSRPPRLRFHAE